MSESLRTRLIAIGAVATLAVLAVVAVLLFTGGDDDGDNGGPDTDLPQLRQPPGGPGFAWVNGQWLEPPYTIESDDLTITFNGTVVRDRTAPATSPVVAPADPVTAEDLAEVASVRLAELGGATSDVPDEALIAMLRDEIALLPAAADVRYVPPMLEIEDRDGNVSGLLLQVLTPPTAEETRDDLAATAQEWRDALAAGAVLMISGGESVTVPGWNAADFFAAVSDVQDLPAGEQGEQMLAVVGAPTIADQLVAAGAPPDSILDRVPEREDDADSSDEPSVLHAAGPATVVDLSRGGQGATLALVNGTHGDYRTPGENAAYFFTTFTAEGGSCPTGAPIKKAARLHNYSIIEFDGNASKVSAFVASSGKAGIFFGCMHGGNAIEFYTTKAAAVAARNAYRARGLNVNTGSHPGNRWYVTMPQAFIRANWASNNTIVQLENCSGANEIASYRPREMIATFGLCTPASSAAVTSSQQFWGRLEGTLADGRERAVGVAFPKAYGSSIYQLQGSGNGLTVLVPAVRDAAPEVVVPVSPVVPIKGRVKFDAQMDQRFGLPRLMSVFGACGATLVDGKWTDAYTFEFSFITTRVGTLWFDVDAFWAASSDDTALYLDGNQNPGRTEHQGPSRDNFRWAVECVTSEPTPTPTPDPTSTPPRTPTPTPTPDPTETPTPTPTATPTATPTPTPTATATPTPTPTATPQPTATPVPGVRLTITPGEVSVYTVVFDDAATEAIKAQFDYDWALALPINDDCTVGTFFNNQATATWDHSDCEHSPGEVIRVLIRFPDGVSISIFGPATGQAELRP